MPEYRDITIMVPNDVTACAFRPIEISGKRLLKSEWVLSHHTVRQIDLGPQPWSAETVADLLMRLDYGTGDAVY